MQFGDPNAQLWQDVKWSWDRQVFSIQRRCYARDGCSRCDVSDFLMILFLNLALHCLATRSPYVLKTRFRSAPCIRQAARQQELPSIAQPGAQFFALAALAGLNPSDVAPARSNARQQHELKARFRSPLKANSTACASKELACMHVMPWPNMR